MLVSVSASGTVSLTFGSNIAVASSITPTNDVHHITGNGTTIQTINVPSTNFSGFVILISDDAFSVGVSGNISKAFQTTDNYAYRFVYDSNTSKWYPEGRT